MKRTARGSISIFLAYVLIFILAAVFALLEVSRVWCLDQRARTDAVMTANSAMSSYNTCLWEKYGLLFLDGQTEWEKRCMFFSKANLDVHGTMNGIIDSQTWNLFGIRPASVEVHTYGLATDQGGRPFVLEAAQKMKYQFTEEMLTDIYEMVSKKESFNSEGVIVAETSKEVSLNENPIDTVKHMKERGVLSLVTEDIEVSQKFISLDDTLQRRKLKKGSVIDAEAISWQEKILFRQYLDQYFQSYVTVDEERALNYELEYLLSGKRSDRQNLMNVVNRLLLVRELSNLQFLRTSPQKQELILATATALAALTLSPELIPAYKTGIASAWAYAESVYDVRLLLDGQHVSLIKNESQWHTDLFGLSKASKLAGKQQNQGLSYKQYLQMFLWTTSDSVLAYRAMDLIEHNTGVRMDCQIYCMNGEIQYVGEPLFSSLLSLGYRTPGYYQFSYPFTINYLEQ